GQVFGEVAIAFGGIDAEALEHVDADLLGLGIDRMGLEARDQLIGLDLAALGADIDIPGLVVDAGADIVELAIGHGQHLGDLVGAMLDAMAEADDVGPAIEIGRPGVRGHRIGIIEEQRARLGYLADILAEIENDRDVALAIEN